MSRTPSAHPASSTTHAVIDQLTKDVRDEDPSVLRAHSIFVTPDLAPLPDIE